nr:MAG TPA: hypothetical protein [Caudoviricetes sp.]
MSIKKVRRSFITALLEEVFRENNKKIVEWYKIQNDESLKQTKL